MRNKGLLRTLSALCLTLVLASGFTIPAFAQGAAPPPAQLSAMLSGGTIPGSMVDDNNEQEENSYEE